MELFSGREIEQNNRTVETQTAFSWRHEKVRMKKAQKLFLTLKLNLTQSLYPELLTQYPTHAAYMLYGPVLSHGLFTLGFFSRRPFSRALLSIFSDLPEQRHQRVREDLEAEPGDHHGRPFHPGTHRGPLEKHPDAGECLKWLFTTVFSL